MEYTQRGFRLRDGRLCASFVVRRDQEQVPIVAGSIGIDWGVRTTVTATNPAYDLPFAGYRKRCEAELAKAQRRMARRHRPGTAPSKGYLRAKRDAARLQKKAARQTRHNARVWAKRVVADHQLVAVEDFRPGFLAKSTMARKAADAAISSTKRELVVRAERAGRTMVMVRPAHTTVTCSKCFAKTKQHLDLATRTFLCTACGHTEDRDRNAARVVLAVAERGHTCVDDVRHLQPSFWSVVGAV
ncbi:RNA-guided endonuclease TnpB family protein [Nocardia alni]|uniref:RNA-guided endonuclease TnpB family protein n=1 Tax=Nocardia alni TaxID=2815723 RepID=UPI0020B3501F|nr:RNA-guided endonuclease TnpB family protein [Nocardia alni]